MDQKYHRGRSPLEDYKTSPMKDKVKDLVYDVFAGHFPDDQWEWIKTNFEAQLTQLTDWIPVEDRQPKSGDRILGCCVFCKHVGEAICDPWKTGKLTHMLFWDSDECKITHWRPLPNPSKEVTDED